MQFSYLRTMSEANNTRTPAPWIISVCLATLPNAESEGIRFLKAEHPLLDQRLVQSDWFDRLWAVIYTYDTGREL